jgi:hypothetical protein
LEVLSEPGRLLTFERAGDAIDAFRSGTVGLFVLVAHGRPLPGGGHYVEVAPDTVITVAELLQAAFEPPERLALVACWGSSTGTERLGDPAAVATVALARGAHEVLATTYELADSVVATLVVEQTLLALDRHDSFAAAVHATFARLLAHDPALRADEIWHWAPLQAIGTLPSRGGT